MMTTAVCSCGYRNGPLAIGAGMLNFETECYVPARCDTCHDIVSADILNPSPTPHGRLGP